MVKATLLIISSFLFLIVAGTFLLAMPAMAVEEPLELIDAFFTATSAVCVTGLIVVDTATRFTFLGKVVILILIQLGGLGLITFSALVLVGLGRRMSLLQREVISTSSVSSDLKVDIKQIGKPIVLYVVLSEGVGALLLFFAFLRHFPIEKAIQHAVFHSISAFCNAGFSTFSDSLMGFSGDWLVLLPIMALIILGGMGFVVLLDIYETVKFKKPIYLHTRLVGMTTLVLLVLGAVFFFFLEYSNVLLDKPLHEQILSSLFHSVTTRTAGFNSVDYFQLTHGTLMTTLVLMIIGGSPGSTAGGVKTTTAAIIFLMAKARIQRKPEPEFGNRSIASRSVADAVTLVALSVIFIMVVTFALQLSELGNVSHSEVEGQMMKLGFEGVSAFGTVGLSMGATPGLSFAGKIIIAITMFVGRLGPLSFFYVLGNLSRKQSYRLYSERVMVG
jgi:trk system potassium uptake protein TrkH